MKQNGLLNTDKVQQGNALPKETGIKALPAIAVNGKLLSCWQNNRISAEELRNAELGQPVLN